jgi:4,5-dihydroxyphthalate decarboxylase
MLGCRPSGTEQAASRCDPVDGSTLGRRAAPLGAPPSKGGPRLARLQLSIAFQPNLRNRAVLDGAIPVEGVELVPSFLHPAETFWRQLKHAEFDVSELSLSSYLIALDHGEAEFTGVPVFTSRRLFHTDILVRDGAGIDAPEDLVGKRIGIPEYQQTGAVWVRAALQHEFGVSPGQVEWWMGRSRDLSHAAATGSGFPAGVTVRHLAAGDDLGSMILRGDLDALGMYVRGTMVDRASADLEHDPRVRRLFPDPVAEGIRYIAKTGIYPINHILVVRRSLVERHPWLPQNLYDAFVESKRAGESELRTDAADYVAAGAMTIAAGDPMPYGFRANAHVLDALRQHSLEQGLTTRLIGFDEIFAPAMLDL